jgi:hypothetical protein
MSITDNPTARQKLDNGEPCPYKKEIVLIPIDDDGSLPF